jgi:tRNA 2-thiocytidine biosynthesis protein TtcA
MLAEWEKRYPGRVQTAFNALTRVVPTHLLDRQLHDFSEVRASGSRVIEGDVAFDDDPQAEVADAAAEVIRFT